MQLVSTTTHKRIFLFFALAVASFTGFAQVNSPYTRYGIGDLTNSQNVINSGMGGISAAFADARTVNFNNPASFASNYIINFDLGVNIESRTLRSQTPVTKYNSANFAPSYLAIATPLSREKGWGMAFGFRPISKINYSILKSERTSVDSMQTLYEGSGGLNEAFWGIGKKWKGFSLGILTGYHFGKKELSTKRSFVNDTVAYAKVDYSTTTNFGGAFFNAGFQYEFLLDSIRNTEKKITKKYFLRLGGTASLGQTLNATQDFVKKTFEYDYSGNEIKMDSLTQGSGYKGKIKIPSGYSFGALLQRTTNTETGIYDNWSIGFDFSATKWSDYTFYGQKDLTVNSWMFKLGGTWNPVADMNSKNYFNKLNYRAGFNIGKDYLNADGKELKTYSITFGAGLPVRTTRGINQITTIQTAFEFGKRGSAVNNVKENFFKLSVGFSLNDIWFIKRKYD